MKLTLIFGIVALCILVCFTPTFSAQGGSKESPTTAQKPVLSLAEKTVDAIRKNDAHFLSALADPDGISLGFDTSKISAARFRKELAEKSGAYCVIFDLTCEKGRFVKTPTGSSLRQLLLKQPVTIVMSSVEGAPLFALAVAKNSKDPNDILFTLYFRRAGGRWRLQQIEYY